MTIIGALSYAELAAMMPHAGGQYVYLREAYSPLWGFLYGWTCFLVIQTGTIAAVRCRLRQVPRRPRVLRWAPRTSSSHTAVNRLPCPGSSEAVFKRDEFTISAGQLVGVGVIVLLTAFNCRGVREGKWVQNIFTVAKTLALLLLIVVGLTVARNPPGHRAKLQQLVGGHPLHGDLSGALRPARRRGHIGGFDLWGGLVVLMVAGGAMVGSLFSRRRLEQRHLHRRRDPQTRAATCRSAWPSAAGW